MRFIVACRLPEGGVLVASRESTSSPEEPHSLGSELGRGIVAVAGDHKVATSILRAVRYQLRKQPRLRARRLAYELARRARHIRQMRHRNAGDFYVAYAGITESGAVDVWCCEPPDFHHQIITRPVGTRGLGIDVKAIHGEFDRVRNEGGSLQSVADTIDELLKSWRRPENRIQKKLVIESTGAG